MDCVEYGEQIAAHVDGALSRAEILTVQEHLRSCPRCAGKFRWETRVKAFLQRRLVPLEPRAALKKRILAELEPRRGFELWGWSFRAHALAAAAAVLLLAPYVMWQSGVEKDIFSGIAMRYNSFREGGAASSHGLVPSARVLDLSPWGYRLLSRRIEEVNGREGRVFVYQGKERDYLMAQEFDGARFSIPSGAGTVRSGERSFLTYREGGVNMVAWMEKDLLCVLASSSSKASLLGLAERIAARS